MKKSLVTALTALLIFIGPLLYAQQSPAQPSWLNAAGKSTQGEFLRLEGETLVIRKDGKEWKIPLADLSLASRNQARALAGAKPPGAVKAGPVNLPMHPAVPKEGDWKNAALTSFPLPGSDRIFLINRGWLQGALISVNTSVVTLQTGGDFLSFPRNQVSLIGLSDWLDPAKRTSEKAIRFRIIMEGPAERAVLHFNNGAIIQRIEKGPEWLEGSDADDKTSADATTISFDKGSDKSITRLACEVSLLPPATGTVACEINNNRANGYSGALTVRFIDPGSGREIAVLEPPVGDEWRMWCRFEVPVEKFLKPAATQKLSPAITKFEPSKVASLGLLGNKAPQVPPNAARIIYTGETARSASVARIDATTVHLADHHHTTIPRTRVAWIELLDWQSAWQADRNPAQETPPLRWSAYGLSTNNSVTLPAGTTFTRLIVPHYPLFGMDRDDTYSVNDERTFRCNKGDMDQSPFHSEMVATLSLPPDPAVNFAYANAYTNAWAGPLEMIVQQVLSGRRVAEFKSGDQELSASRKIQSSKLIIP